MNPVRGRHLRLTARHCAKPLSAYATAVSAGYLQARFASVPRPPTHMIRLPSAVTGGLSAGLGARLAVTRARPLGGGVAAGNPGRRGNHPSRNPFGFRETRAVRGGRLARRSGIPNRQGWRSATEPFRAPASRARAT